MAVIEEAIFTRATTHSGLSALVSSRVYPSEAPQNGARPYVTFYRLSSGRVSAMGSDTGVAQSRFTFSCYAERYADAKSVANQVRAAFQRYRATVSGVEILASFIEAEQDSFDDDVKLHQIDVDFLISYRE